MKIIATNYYKKDVSNTQFLNGKEVNFYTEEKDIAAIKSDINEKKNIVLIDMGNSYSCSTIKELLYSEKIAYSDNVVIITNNPNWICFLEINNEFNKINVIENIIGEQYFPANIEKFLEYIIISDKIKSFIDNKSSLSISDNIRLSDMKVENINVKNEQGVTIGKYGLNNNGYQYDSNALSKCDNIGKYGLNNNGYQYDPNALSKYIPK